MNGTANIFDPHEDAALIAALRKVEGINQQFLLLFLLTDAEMNAAELYKDKASFLQKLDALLVKFHFSKNFIDRVHSGPLWKADLDQLFPALKVVSDKQKMVPFDYTSTGCIGFFRTMAGVAHHNDVAAAAEIVRNAPKPA